jgi:hypothetical protein
MSRIVVTALRDFDDRVPAGVSSGVDEGPEGVGDIGANLA